MVSAHIMLTLGVSIAFVIIAGFVLSRFKKETSFFNLTVEKILILFIGLLIWVFSYYQYLIWVGVSSDRLNAFWGRDWPFIAVLLAASYLILSMLLSKKEERLKIPAFFRWIFGIFLWIVISGAVIANTLVLIFCKSGDIICSNGLVILVVWIIVSFIALIAAVIKSVFFKK